MKKIVFSFSLLILTIFSFSNVTLANSIKKTNQAKVTVNNLGPSGVTVGGENLITYTFDVRYNGVKFKGYCLDISYNASRNYSYTCSPDNSSSAKAIAYIFEHPTNDILDSLAIRMIAVLENGNKSAKGKELYLVRWLQVKTGLYPASRFTPDELRITGDSLLEAAFSKAQEAISYAKSASSLKNSFEFTNKQESGKQVTYTVKSKQKLKKNQVAFTCEGCNVVDYSWEDGGTQGKITIEDTKDDCSYIINAYYPGSQVIACDCGPDCQRIAISAASAGDEEVDTTGTPTQYFADTLEKADYCKDSTVCPGSVPEPVANVNNCCESDTVSTVKEPTLNELFCRSNDLQVDYFNDIAGNQKYVEYNSELTGEDEKYCKMYCTEDLFTQIPGALTAINGKYFQLASYSIALSDGTVTVSNTQTAPYVNSKKRCRIKVQYDAWLKDYQSEVDNSINQFNSYQENSANYEMYQDAVDQKKTINLSDVYVHCSADEGKTDNYDKGSYSYDDFTFKTSEKYRYRNVKIKNDTRSIYKSEEVIDNGMKETSHREKSYWSGDLSSVISSIETKKAKNGTKAGSKKCGTDPITNATKYCDYNWSCTASADAEKLLTLKDELEDVETTRTNYKNAREGAKESYNASVNKIKELQKTLTRCDYYFNKNAKFDGENNVTYGGTSGSTDLYNLTTTMSTFKYTQVYQDDYGNPKEAQVSVQYNQNCSIKLDEEVGGNHVFANSEQAGSGNYSSIYSKSGNIEDMIVFGKELGGALEYSHKDPQLTSTTYYKKFLAEQKYEANKLFWHDGKYTAECTWERANVDKYTVDSDGSVIETSPNDPDSPIYRLVPRGEVYNYKSDLINYTDHSYLFTYSTSYDGHFETYWNLRGFGENGEFDTYFENGGQTCAAQNPADSELLTCKLNAFHGGSFYGCCCGDGNGVTYKTDSCESYDDKAVLYDFKIIDPAKVFPASTDGYAENWKTETGKSVQEAIEALGANLNTYSPKALSYSFRLTPNDMKQIKQYNASLNGYGGYTDNNLECDCSAGQGDKDNGKSCVQCKSRFLTNLANGKILSGSELSNVWNRKDKTIQQVRDSDVKWAVNK